MCKGAHMWGEYRYKGVSPILNEHVSGGSRMYPTQVPHELKTQRAKYEVMHIWLGNITEKH